ncbi:MAG: hypothetical protein QM765_52945 [Myxococcales bacterium]
MSAMADRSTLAAALASAALLLCSAPAQATTWEYVGVGDCTGNDTGSSLGAQPDPSRCGAATSGTAVVCWDDVQYKNPKARKPVCIYKRVQAAQCTGGASPGFVYRCGSDSAHGATVAPPPGPGPAVVAPPPGPAGPPPAAAGYQWRYTRVSDCVGNDTASSKGSVPALDRCGAGTVGQTAVCWDGAQHRNPKLNQAACIYKRTPAQACSGGTAPGVVYECVALGQAQPPVHTAEPAQPATPYVPPAAPGYAWSYQRIGDCTGGDLASTRGPYPALERCEKNTVGMTSVCWDGVAQRNKASSHAACTYKRFAAAGCKGGGSPGYLYECIALSPGQPPPEYPEVQLARPPPPPVNPPPSAAPGYTWRYTRVDGCSGGSIGFSKGEDPSPELCDASTVGLAAVCWDDKHHKHHDRKHAACAYKRVPAQSCYGDEHPGALYECVRTDSAYATPPSDPPPSTYRPAYSWRFLRTDGCHGADEGNTPGAVPDADRCDASSVGHVSVCFDGVSTRHPSGKVACNYKDKSAANCTGSQHPGALYECVASTVSAEPPPHRPPPPAKPGYVWRYARVDGCRGRDDGSSNGSTPDAERCDASHVGQVSICWDGESTRHPSGKVACNYKRASSAECSGSEHPGALYECVAAAGTSNPPPPPSPPPPPAANLRYDWKTTGFGNCNGNDVGQTAGGAPLPAACDASSVGKSAVCWSTSCSYKSIPASSCKGAANSGTLYECVASDANAAPGPSAPAGSLVWNYVGVADCTGNDTGSSAGSAPDPSRCGPATAGLSAVCWDGVQQKRGASSTPVCTYKRVRAGDCRGGAHPGYVYRCGP